MKIRFTKMQGLGNDFVVIDAISQPIALSSAQVRYVADRHFGVGCDQLLMVERAGQEGVDFRYRIFNADGGEVEQCGNGARCFARFVYDKGLTHQRQIQVETKAGSLSLYLNVDNRVTVNMGMPIFTPSDGSVIVQPLVVEGQTLDITAVSMGNPHAVQIVENVETAPVAELGPLIESHVCFPQGVNAGFMQIMSRQRIRLRVYERGAGETLACGTGACAAVVTGIMRGLLDSPINVQMKGGELEIAWDGLAELATLTQPVWMTGPAEVVFEGEINLPVS